MPNHNTSKMFSGNYYYINPSEDVSSSLSETSSEIETSSSSVYATESCGDENYSVKVEYQSSLPMRAPSATLAKSSSTQTSKKSSLVQQRRSKDSSSGGRSDYGYANVKSFYTGVTDLLYSPTERDHWEVAKYARKLTTLPQNATLSARYTAGVLSRSANVILTPGAYVLAPGLAGCPNVVFEIYPKAGVISVGSGKRVFFEFLNDNNVFVRFELERRPSNGMTFSENLIDKLWKNHFFWANEPVVVAAHLGNFLAASGDMTNETTGPFSSAVFYGASEHGGPSSVVPRMAPCLGYFSDWESYCKTCVYCPFDVMMAVRMHELKTQMSFHDE